ncbi:hypothetical protein Tco_1459142 [Tanacetum coccineum]
MVVHNEDGNPARANIKQALGSFKDGDGDGDSQFQKAEGNSGLIHIHQLSSKMMFIEEGLQDGLISCIKNVYPYLHDMVLKIEGILMRRSSYIRRQKEPGRSDGTGIYLKL